MVLLPSRERSRAAPQWFRARCTAFCGHGLDRPPSLGHDKIGKRKRGYPGVFGRPREGSKVDSEAT